MKHLKLFSLLISMFLFFGCSEYISIIEANKTLNISGLSKGKNHLAYYITIKVKKDITFKSITLNGTEIKESLYLKDLSTGLSSTKINEILSKGNYLFGFRKFDLTDSNKKETIMLSYKIDGKLFNQKKEVVLKKPKTNK
ncbi:hypothetical protein [Polaribacter aquimarinus]|nr:hypothetical protein [Polaribacter aquimarinus]